MSSLDAALLEILNKTTAAINSGIDILTAELPDVVHQLLVWYFVYYTLRIIIAIGTSYAYYRFMRFTIIPLWDLDIKSNALTALSIAGPILSTVFTIIVVISTINIQWLQIWIAPKIWLIQYTTTLLSK